MQTLVIRERKKKSGQMGLKSHLPLFGYQDRLIAVYLKKIGGLSNGR